LLLGGAGEARAQALVADLSDHLIAVTTGFVGTELLLFGATDGDEGDIVVVVRGPAERVMVRRKERTGGIWVNRHNVAFSGVPSFYHLASSRPLTDITSPRVRSRHQLGLDNVRFGGLRSPRSDVAAFRQALIRNKRRDGLYPNDAGDISQLGNRLFRTAVVFPSNVPTGSYTVTVYLLRKGAVVSAQTTPLVVSKIGIGARVYDFAHRNSALYGIASIFMALMAGWLAGAIFKRA
ncbi:MAG: TIGR02186 family protein, partial [Alphaproteobacteria bacterium]|nr:TIGR02186 family protein [Alphaproteobacteria bacterium]